MCVCLCARHKVSKLWIESPYRAGSERARKMERRGKRESAKERVGALGTFNTHAGRTHVVIFNIDNAAMLEASGVHVNQKRKKNPFWSLQQQAGWAAEMTFFFLDFYP